MASISSGASFTAGVSKRWGTLLLAVVALFSLRRLLIEPISAHYLLFTRAGQALWHASPVYGSDHGTGIGLWLYSPFCGMFFFGPFSLLPDVVGMTAYVLVSLALFVAGAELLSRSLRVTPVMREIFYALCSAPMLSAVVTTKLEIAMTGILMAAAALLVEGRLEWLAGLSLAVIANWKLQPAPTILLLLLVLWRSGRAKSFAFGLAAGLVLAVGVPYLFLPTSYLMHEEALWRSTLAGFTRVSLFNFENVFCFLKFSLGIETPWVVAQAVSAAAGLAFAACLWPLAKQRARGILLACAWGSAFSMAFSPLGQNNGMILAAPLLLWFSEIAFAQLTCPRERVFWISVIAITLIVPYSDLVPPATRDWLHALSIKQMLLLAVCVFGIYLEHKRDIASVRLGN